MAEAGTQTDLASEEDSVENGQASSTASESESGTGESQSQDSDNPAFPLAAGQDTPFNYLQDLKRRKMKMKKQMTPAMKTSKLLGLIRLQSKHTGQSPSPNPTISESSNTEPPFFGDEHSGMNVFGEGETPSEQGHLNTGKLEFAAMPGYNPEETPVAPNSETPYQCRLCPVAFATPLSLRGHMSSHRLPKKFVCPICAKSFAHSSTLNYHVRKHKGDLRYKCDQCDKRFLKPFRLKAHILSMHSSEKPFACRYCEKSFSSNMNLNRHTRVHTGEKPFLCLLCGKRFRDNSSFSMHRKYHTENKLFECDLCGKTFVKMGLLRTHKKCVHVVDKIHECFLCNKAFKARDYLRKHLMVHQTNKRFKCDFCESSFSRAGALKKHRYLHTGEEPFKCDVCLKGFRDIYTLTKHKRLHERKVESNPPLSVDEVNEKKAQLYECDQCNRKYSLSGSLKIHKQKYCKGEIEVKTEELNLFCTGCGMLFHHKQSLAKHMRKTCEAIVRKKDKVFLCSTCGLVFFSKVMLNDHLRTTTCSGNTSPENYKCGVCGAEFSHRATLSKHKKLHGDMLPDVADGDPTEGDNVDEDSSKMSFPVDENGKRLYECKYCKETFRSKSALYDTHMRKCHDRPALEKKNECEFCSRKFHSKSDLRAHIRIHTGEKPFTCGICGKSFTQRGHVSMHIKIHTGQRDFPCTICGKAFQFATTLRNHVKLHTGERPHVCHLCGKGFIKSNNLKNHIKMHEKKEKEMEENANKHPEEFIPADPNDCTISFSPLKKTPSGKLLAQARGNPSSSRTRTSNRTSKGSGMKKLIEEEMTPVEEMGEELPLIKKEPVESDDQMTDEFGETRENDQEQDNEGSNSEELVAVDLKCPFCGRICSTPYALATHIKCHTGARPFMCQDCGKSFLQASHLRSHMQIHGKREQNFRCIVCLEEFATSKLLHSHMKLHKGERPYGCYFCDKAYGTSQHLRRHVRSSHPKEMDIDMNVLLMPTSTLNDGRAVEAERDNTGRRVYRCYFCEKFYFLDRHLRRHVQTSHPERDPKNLYFLRPPTSDAGESESDSVSIKTESMWDPDTSNDYSASEMTPSKDTEDKDGQMTAGHTSSTEDPDTETPENLQERIYVPPQIQQTMTSPVDSDGSEKDVSRASSPDKNMLTENNGKDEDFIVEVKQEPVDDDYEN
ncbi:zinc finger protein 845-like [Haliotis rufescens]|uniref:zinc finger protein 845-like n=1 Tax=Haliotis rufescens TaxID=6454 RepID=UPI001EB04F21|nr:zinc finger protein 845-like [Haliotis rufescens]